MKSIKLYICFNIDRANMAFWHFLHEEVYSTLCERPGKFDLCHHILKKSKLFFEPLLYIDQEDLCQVEETKIGITQAEKYEPVPREKHRNILGNQRQESFKRIRRQESSTWVLTYII
jgi:hypothetical protein